MLSGINREWVWELGFCGIEILEKIKETANLRVHEAVFAGLFPVHMAPQKALGGHMPMGRERDMDQ